MSHRTLSVLRHHDDRTIPEVGTYEIDRAHTAVEFIARHMMITKVRGRFKEFHGQIAIAENPEDSHVAVEIATASLDTGNSARDTHLRSADFFEVERYPTITFRSTFVGELPDGRWALMGDLTIRDTTRSVTMTVEFDGADVSPAGDERIGFSATTEVDREAFGLTWNEALETGGVLVGRTVRIELAVQATAVLIPAVA